MNRTRLVSLLGVALIAWSNPSPVQAGRPEPVSTRPERGRVAVTVAGRQFSRPGTYYVGQDTSLNDLFAKAGLDLQGWAYISRAFVEREREGKKLRFSIPVDTLDLQFDFQDGDSVRFPEVIY